ncbi:CotO family spore coat protein [Sutcliffiella halmapala]|uniref:CotO family spore coat protein n=1 Tax=Sutcliffiella halmapala TaxID=79882 RepID=UPI000994A8E9|nr:CotO family spore coat protein [Sutcliffiella halmapala]
MKKQTDKIKQMPLLYIQTVSNSNVAVPMQSEIQLDVVDAKRRMKKQKIQIQTIDLKKEQEEAEMKKAQKRPFHSLSLEEKIYELTRHTPEMTKKMCKIITLDGEYVGKVAGYQNEILEIKAPNTEDSIFLTIQEVKELHVIGI